MITYTTTGTCSKQISFSIKNGVIEEVKFDGGCQGNLQGMMVLLCGMKVDDVVKKLKGIDCKGRGTSCPDQLAKALEMALEKEKLQAESEQPSPSF